MTINRRAFLGGAISAPFVKAPPIEDSWPFEEYSVPIPVESNFWVSEITSAAIRRHTAALVESISKNNALLSKLSASEPPTEQQLEFEF